MGELVEPNDALARGGTALSRFVAGGDVADLPIVLACVRALPAGLPERATLAAGLISAIVRLQPSTSLSLVDCLPELIEIVDRDPPPGEQWAATRGMAGAAAIMIGVAERHVTPQAALSLLSESDPGSGSDPSARIMAELAREAVSFFDAMQSGDLAGMQGMADLIGRLRAEYNVDHPMLDHLAEMIGGAQDVILAGQTGDRTRTRRGLERMQTGAAGLPAESDVRGVYEDMSTVLEALGAMEGAEGAPFTALPEESLAAIDVVVERSGSGGHAAIVALMRAMAEVGLGADVSRERMDAGIERVRRIAADMPDGSSDKTFAVYSLGLALMRRHEVWRDPNDLAEMAEVLGTARNLASSPDNGIWSHASQLLSFASDQLDDPVLGRRLMVESLRGFAWSVLIQTNVADAATAAQDAASDAMDAALRCLRDDAVADAVAALDAGRGLTLFAATEFRDVGMRLDALGRSDLADRWRVATATGNDARLPLDLRRDVLAAMSAAESGRLFDPPPVPEIQQTLSTLDIDALVYLVPGQGFQNGIAVIVPVRGEPGWVSLPDLAVDGNHDIGSYLEAVAARSADLDRSATDAPRDLSAGVARLRSRVDKLCEWSWWSAVSPVLDVVARRVPRTDRRPWRLALVPMGDLARVPWHAARRPGDEGYALETVAISYTASARMLCDSARRSPVRVSSLGLIVGDPDTTDPSTRFGAPDLPAARAEAYAIHQTFYRAAGYAGRQPNGSPGRGGQGRRAEVTAWLTTRRPSAGPMLHLACHGVTTSGKGAASSHLLLASGEKLTADEIVALAAEHPDRAISLVVLAACRSGVSAYGYDEAYSLVTTFLAAGVRTVLGTQWSVPDRATSLLMFMFHHYLRAEGHPAWDALRRAQLWMLDPGRQPPETMPGQLRGQLTDTEPADLLAWAGFTHSGH